MGPGLRRRASETSVDGLGERAGDVRVECVVAGSAKANEREDWSVGEGVQGWVVKGLGDFCSSSS